MIWLVFIVSQLADVWSTKYALDRGAVEANPAIRWLMDRLGKGWVAAKIAIASAGAYVLWHAVGDAGVAAVALVFFGIAFRNYRMVRK